MTFDGTLSIDDNLKESKLDGTFLARQGSGDPFGDATAFLENRGFSDGDLATITGSNGNIGQQPVIFMTNAVPKVATAAAVAPSISKKGAKKAAAKKPASKKAAKKMPAEKTKRAGSRPGSHR